MILVFIVTAVIFSCGSKSDNTGMKSSDGVKRNESVSEDPSTQVVHKSDTGKIDLKWDFEVLKEGEYGEPVTRLSIYVNGKKHIIKEEVKFGFAELPESEIKSLGFEDALTACRGWWAGGGEEYWIVRGHNELVIMMRELDEVSDEKDEQGFPKPYIGQPKYVGSIPISD
ncbi:MAG: hypothetical protein N2510_05605 [Ignavibacteria bacterium]|nr:hypothetical protein [Ignavibacteria bacterium]